MATQIVPQQQEAISQPTVMEVLASAVLKDNLDVGVVERLTTLHLQLMDRDARIEFAESFARFKAKVPAIVKDASIVVSGQTRSKFAKLDQIADKVFPALLEEGITHRWKTRTTEDGRTFVTCYLRKGAYEEEGATLAAAADMSGSKNAIQGQGSTVSYLERYTFVASCGIVVKDQDTDGGMSMDEGAELIGAILQAEDMDALRASLREAKRAALEARDYKAMKLIDEAWDRRKGELNA